MRAKGKFTLFSWAVRERPDNLSNPIKLIHNDIGKIVDQCWNWLSEQYSYVELGPHVIMPNHFHGIVEIVGAGFPRPEMEKYSGRETRPLQKLCSPKARGFKAFSPKLCNLM